MRNRKYNKTIKLAEQFKKLSQQAPTPSIDVFQLGNYLLQNAPAILEQMQKAQQQGKPTPGFPMPGFPMPGQYPPSQQPQQPWGYPPPQQQPQGYPPPQPQGYPQGYPPPQPQPQGYPPPQPQQQPGSQVSQFPDYPYQGDPAQNRGYEAILSKDLKDQLKSELHKRMARKLNDVELKSLQDKWRDMNSYFGIEAAVFKKLSDEEKKEKILEHFRKNGMNRAVQAISSVR